MSKIKIFLFIALSMPFISCEEQILNSDEEGTPQAFLTIVNAVVGSGTLVYSGYPSDSLVNNSATASVTNPRRYVFDATNTTFKQLKVWSKNDPSKVYFDSTINFQNGGTYSLFLGGDTLTVAKLFVVESDEFYSVEPDSTYRVRVLSIAKNSPAAVNVTLSTSTSTNEFTNVPYGEPTSLKTYSAKSTGGGDPSSRTFQVRDAANPSTVMGSSSVSTTTARFGMVTVILRGVVGASAGVTVVYY